MSKVMRTQAAVPFVGTPECLPPYRAMSVCYKTLACELKRQLKYFATYQHRRILEYRWQDYNAYDQVLREAGMGQITCIVRQHQLRLYWHVARLSTKIPPIGFCLSDPWGWTMPSWVMWSPIWRLIAWRAWRLPGRWPDGGWMRTVARWTRRRAAPSYALTSFGTNLFGKRFNTRWIHILQILKWFLKEPMDTSHRTQNWNHSKPWKMNPTKLFIGFACKRNAFEKPHKVNTRVPVYEMVSCIQNIFSAIDTRLARM